MSEFKIFLLAMLFILTACDSRIPSFELIEENQKLVKQNEELKSALDGMFYQMKYCKDWGK